MATFDYLGGLWGHYLAYLCDPIASFRISGYGVGLSLEFESNLGAKFFGVSRNRKNRTSSGNY